MIEVCGIFVVTFRVKIVKEFGDSSLRSAPISEA